MTNVFDERDHAQLIGPPEAFEQAKWTINPLKNHLALEVVAQLAAHGLDFRFQGGTALHTRFPKRLRFSVDVDIAADLDDVHRALKRIVDRFQHTKVLLKEPPGELSVEGVRHVLTFPGPGDGVEILVEVIPLAKDDFTVEPLHLAADGYDWQEECDAPTFETFAGQKLAVLCGTTIGRQAGRGQKNWRINQTLAKQIFDLGELLYLDLDQDLVWGAFEVEVGSANSLRGTTHSVASCASDAIASLTKLQGPRANSKDDEVRYGMWEGFKGIKGLLGKDWDDITYRVTAGCIARVAGNAAAPWSLVARPLREDAVPAEIQARLEAEGHMSGIFAAALRPAWAWAPRQLW